jgi:arabinose-5-phosphate isomerase
MLVMGDALAMTVLELRGFKPQDFARHHPSGAIGRALLLRVRDIMREESRNPVAIASQTVKEALLIMTRSKAGCVCVVDARGRLIGVFTDGDFRRHIAANEAVMKLPLKDVMTRNPVHISADALAVEALRIFNERSIDDLIVVDAGRRPVGLVDSQDLPKLKLM